MGGAFVKGHGDVGAKRALDFHDLLRPQEEGGAVEVGAELDTVGEDGADFREAEDLETAAVSEDRPGPIHELMQTAGGADDVHAGADVEVVGVAKKDLGAHFDKFAGIQGLDAGLSADGHEDGGLDDAAGCGQASQAGFGAGVCV